MIEKSDKKKNGIKGEIIINTRKIISKMGHKKSSTEKIARSINITKDEMTEVLHIILRGISKK